MPLVAITLPHLPHFHPSSLGAIVVAEVDGRVDGDTREESLGDDLPAEVGSQAERALSG